MTLQPYSALFLPWEHSLLVQNWRNPVWSGTWLVTCHRLGNNRIIQPRVEFLKFDLLSASSFFPSSFIAFTASGLFASFESGVMGFSSVGVGTSSAFLWGVMEKPRRKGVLIDGDDLYIWGLFRRGIRRMWDENMKAAIEDSGGSACECGINLVFVWFVFDK